MFPVSARSAVEPFHAMDVLAEANRRRAAGRSVVSLAVGQPSHPAPAVALEAARQALEIGRLGYTDALGTQSLRQAIAQHYAEYYGTTVAPERIAVMTGSSAAFNVAFLTLFDAGDRVAITRPGYPAYRNILAALGLQPVEIAVGEETGHTLTPEALKAAEAEFGRIKGVLLASPANPTGTVTGRAALAALADYCAQTGTAFISDEIYHGLTFAGEETTAIALSDEAVVINSFSKYYCMTGWRIGWMVLPQHLVRAVERVTQSLYISAPELSQIAAAAAFRGKAELDGVRENYRANRQILADRLPGLGFQIASPMDGAFYAYADVSRMTNDTMDFAWKMLREIDVAITPGIDFDPVNGHRTVRLSYAGATEDIVEALDRIAAWV
ncbi:aminotransferase class I/II-fold pyridoxal phosphate-dependent enzyme [Rhizobium sp. EC-SD404]|uniref:pyridoxal phosphate-dependent aminotransferase n=1 Tax=Rhizobium sp. EC-SD404 TaxID=2038389 RepID=UPI0012579F6B|nr:aminotransferase class I/II-fold pyridoxal phosphate-dependent enzyme [Rhizobium sp. EC-SD404]VVT18270.1 1-aminocyclopropane-1-carboxylate deaminase [Rhizobium sp. EC-SD404]